MTFVPFLVGIVFIAIHFLANVLLPAERIKRMMWFSFSGGLAVSYIFIYLLPTLHREQAMIEEPYRRLTMESEIYFIGLIGVVVFLGIQVIISRREVEHNASFWAAILFYALYNALVSFVVLSLEVSGVEALFYSFAIGLHFVAIAHDMWRGFPAEYDQYGKFVLAAGIISGWIVALSIDLAPIARSIIFAFVSGAMLFNVFKNELPNIKELNYFSFIAAVLIYSAITISLKFFFEW